MDERTRSEPWVQRHIRLTPDQDEALLDYAESVGQTVTDVIRAAVDRYVQVESARLEARRS